MQSRLSIDKVLDSATSQPWDFLGGPLPQAVLPLVYMEIRIALIPRFVCAHQLLRATEQDPIIHHITILLLLVAATLIDTKPKTHTIRH